MSLDPVLIWFLVGLVLLVAEFAAPGVVVGFFGVGAWVAAVLTWVGVTPTVSTQLLAFGVASVGLLLVLRRWVKAQFTGHVHGVQEPLVELEEFRGLRLPVIVAIEPGSREGRVEFKGSSWQAISDEAIAAGETVEVVGTEGIHLKVQRVRTAEAEES